MYSNSKTRARLFFLSIIALFLIAASPLQEVEPIDITNLTAMLLWLAGAGGAYVSGQVVSYLAENWPKWHNLPTWLKVTLPMFTSALISVLATVALNYGTQLEVVAPWWSIVSYAVLTYLATQKAHVAQLRAGYGDGAKEIAAESVILNQEPQGRG